MTARPQIRDNSVLACQDSDPKHNDSTSDKGARAAAPPEAQVFPDARTGAVWLARRGLPVFRTNLQTLTPKCPQFWEKASADPAQVACDFTDATGESVADNVAVSTGKSIVVVDADVKKGQPGLASLARLDAQGLPRETLTIRTPSGGLHRYYRVDPARVYRNRQDWRPGVDIRGHHGYANAPGSVKPDGSTYTIELDAPIADLPEAFANELACGHAASDAPAIETDKYEDDWSIGEAIRFLPTAEPDAGPGNHHDPLIRIGHVLFDFGITTRRAVELIEDHWPQAPAVSDVLEYQIERLAAGRKEPWGAKHPRARPSVYDTFERAYLANPADEHPRFAANSNGEGRRVTELPVVRACDLAGKPVPPRRWLVREMIPDSDVTLLFGDGGTGKSMLALQLAVATVAGKEWLGNLPEKGPVILVSAEDDLDEMHRRLAADVARLGIDLADLPDLHLVSLAGHDAVMGAPGNKSGVIAPTALWRKLVALVGQIGPRLVVLDTLADVYAGDENVRAEVRQFIGMSRGLAIEHALSVVLLAHPSLSGMASGSGTSGSTAWSNSVRSRLYLERIKSDDGLEIDADLRKLTTKKLNNGRVGQQIRLRWDRGCFVLDGGGVSLDKAEAEAEAERLFLDMLAVFERQGRDVSPKFSSAYAPTVFAKLPEAEGFGKKALERAMNRLLAAGRIHIATSGPPSKQRVRLAIGPPGGDP